MLFRPVFAVHTTSAEFAPSDVRSLRHLGVLAVRVDFAGFRHAGRFRYRVRILNVGEEDRPVFAVVDPNGNIFRLYGLGGQGCQSGDFFLGGVRLLNAVGRGHQFGRVPFDASAVAAT